MIASRSSAVKVGSPSANERPASAEERNRLMLRARDAMDRRYADELDVRTLAGIVGMSEAHFIRTFKEVFAETPHRYLQRRRVERAMFLLRALDLSLPWRTDYHVDMTNGTTPS